MTPDHPRRGPLPIRLLALGLLAVNLDIGLRAFGDLVVWHYGRAWHRASGLLGVEALIIFYAMTSDRFVAWASPRITRYALQWRERGRG